jgi:hypothetical protein
VGGWEKSQKKRKEKKPGAGRGENKVAKKKLRSGLIRAEKGQAKKVNLGWHRDRKEHPISAPSIHVGALVGADLLWPYQPP